MVIKGDTRSLDYSSYGTYFFMNYQVTIWGEEP